MEEFALSKTYDVADLVQYAAIKVWSSLFVEAGELWLHETFVSGFVDGDWRSIRQQYWTPQPWEAPVIRSETTRIQPEEVMLEYFCVGSLWVL